MVRAWYMDNEASDCRLEHRFDTSDLSLEDLTKIGVLYWKIGEKELAEGKLEDIKKNRGYTYEDVIEVSPTALPEYESKIKKFFEEHLHTDEEIRYIVGGSGYFDVRDGKDQWIRIRLTEGDLIVLPAGIYHRFTVDSNNYIKARRLFIGEPVWTPYNRPVDDMDARKSYLQQLKIGGW